jgi:hypothetical protein
VNTTKKEAFIKQMDENRRLQADGGVISRDTVAQCQRKLESDILLHNMTHAANHYMTCINHAAVFAVLEDPEDSASINLGSSVVFGFAAGVSMLLL